jgi:hypothetical protein
MSNGTDPAREIKEQLEKLTKSVLDIGEKLKTTNSQLDKVESRLSKIEGKGDSGGPQQDDADLALLLAMMPMGPVSWLMSMMLLGPAIASAGMPVNAARALLLGRSLQQQLRNVRELTRGGRTETAAAQAEEFFRWVVRQPADDRKTMSEFIRLMFQTR